MPRNESTIETDPRIYLAAERTLLAWIRTGVALMGFGFVIARFGVFLRQFFFQAGRETTQDVSHSLVVGLVLVAAGMMVCAVSAFRHRRTLRALDEGKFRLGHGSGFAFAVVALLVLVGTAMIVLLLRL